MKFLKCAVLPALLAEGTVLLFLLVCSFILQKSSDPASAIRILPILGLVLSSILCGLLSAVLSGEERLENPLLAGGIMALLHLILSLLPGAEEKKLLLPIILLALQIGLSFFSGLLIFKKGKNNAQKMRRKAKKRYRGGK